MSNNFTTPKSYAYLLGLRWAAWFGQFFTLIFCYYFFHIEIPLEEVSMILSISLAVLIFQSLDYFTFGLLLKQNFLYGLFYDLTQLFSLLFVTGGLNNPFCLLLIGPMAVSATLLQKKKCYFMTAATFVYIFLLWHSPFALPWKTPQGLVMPENWLIGHGLGLLIASTFITLYVGLLSQNSRKLQQAIQVLNSTVIQEKNKAKLGVIAAATAHELGSPLASMTLIVEDLLEEDLSFPKYQEDLSLLKNLLTKCKEILKALDQNKLDSKSGTLPSLELKPGLEMLLQEHQKSGIPFSLELFLKNPLCLPNSYEMRYILSNILSNAFSYANSLVTVVCEENQDFVKISIQDDGPGFSKAILPRLGLPFNSTRSFKSTNFGLGLYIATQLVNELKAHVSFFNNKGACVVLEFDKNLFKNI